MCIVIAVVVVGGHCCCFSFGVLCWSLLLVSFVLVVLNMNDVGIHKRLMPRAPSTNDHT